jgi:hypothetical protein
MAFANKACRPPDNSSNIGSECGGEYMPTSESESWRLQQAREYLALYAVGGDRPGNEELLIQKEIFTRKSVAEYGLCEFCSESTQLHCAWMNDVRTKSNPDAPGVCAWDLLEL